jgi:hypothetical protein
VTFSVIAAQWIGLNMSTKKGDDDSDETGAAKKPSGGTIAVFVLWIIAVLGTLTAWAYLGYCVLASFIKHRQFPNVQSCDATLLDPLFYVTSVVLTVLAIGLIGMAMELAISYYYKSQGACRWWCMGGAAAAAAGVLERVGCRPPTARPPVSLSSRLTRTPRCPPLALAAQVSTTPCLDQAARSQAVLARALLTGRRQVPQNRRDCLRPERLPG